MPVNIWWILILAPLVSASLCALVLRRWGTACAGVSVGSAVLCFLVVLWGLASGAQAPAQWDWLSLPGLEIALEMRLDGLATLMLVVVTGIGLLVHVFSLGYMAEDDAKWRYFGGLSLFMFSMTGIVVSDNLGMIFVFWELVGVSSYLLIGHWFRKPAASAAANKAFLANRIGDVGFLLGIIGVYVVFNTLSISELKAILPEFTEKMGEQQTLVMESQKQEGVAEQFKVSFPPVDVNFLFLLIALGLFCGAVGKSAQFPLHVWLPDAMEGPTPVSALIHAATMVAAGVYLLARVFFVLALSAEALVFIAWIGAGTAVLAALMATQQSDIKRVLAYSTLSQLGMMVMAVGVADPKSAMFHLTTHAFFKALLFLGAGAVIHALHHEQNIWKMGGLARKLPVVFITFLIGTLALAGCPGLSGFFSKDAIFAAAQERGEMVLFWLAAFTALLTAFYMVRLVIVVFLGEARDEHADHPHKLGWVMLGPLILLALPSLAAGYGELIPKWLAGDDYEYHKHDILVYVASIGAFVLGSAGAIVLYYGKIKEPLTVSLLRDRFYIDEFYDRTFVRGIDVTAALLSGVDRWLVRGAAVRSVTFLVAALGHFCRFLVSGSVQVYVFFMALGLLVLLLWNLL